MEQIGKEHPELVRQLAAAGPLLRANLLSLIADRLECNSASLMVASGQDLQSARAAGLFETARERLLVDAKGIRDTCARLRQAAEALSLGGGAHSKGGAVLLLGVSNPLQVVEAASLCLAAGRACILAEDSLAAHSLAFMGGVIRGALMDLGLPDQALLWLDRLDELMDEEFSIINDQLALVIWLGHLEPEDSLKAHIRLTFERIMKASDITALLNREASQEQEEQQA